MNNFGPLKSTDTEIESVFNLMDQNLFATVINVVEGRPFISHLPLTPKRVGDNLVLLGHLARANPHWKFLANSLTTVIFHGPHTYITPQWYAENDVPTWNYLTLHLVGKIVLIVDYDGIIECLQEQTAHLERHWPSGWEFFIPDDLTGENLPKNIVGLSMKVDEITFKRKLGQTRSAADRAGIMKGLQARGDDNSLAVFNEMKKLFPEVIVNSMTSFNITN